MSNTYIKFNKIITYRFFFKLPIILFFLFTSGLAYVLILITKPFKTIKVYTFDAGAFGHYFMDSLLTNLLKKKNHIIFSCISGNDKYSNKFVEQFINKKFFNSIFFKYLDFIITFLPFGKSIKSFDFRFKTGSKDIFGFFYYKRKLAITFSDIQDQKFNKFLENYGIDEKDKIVTINIRDNYYYHILKKKITTSDFARNSLTYQDLIPTLIELKKRKYKILRIGRFREPLNNDLNNLIIDLVDKNLDPAFDFWICKRTNLHIGNNGAIDSLPGYFQKKCLMFELSFITEAFNWCPGILAPSKLYWKKNNNLLTLNEYLNLSHNQRKNEKFLESNIYREKVNPQDILNLTMYALNNKIIVNERQKKMIKLMKEWDRSNMKMESKRYFIFFHPEFNFSEQFLDFAGKKWLNN